MSAAGFLVACEAEYAKGNAWALAQVLDACGQEGVPLPPWAAKAYSEGMERVRRGSCSWTGVLGGALVKGEHADALERQERLLGPAYRIVTEMCTSVPGREFWRRDTEMYEEACNRLCDETGERIAPTTLKKYMREMKRRVALVG